MEIQPSYDGSVNLIINDDKNTPRLINSRFSTREKNTYEIVDRIGENDTNIYSSTNDWNITGLNNDVKRYIRLLAYYGYDYEGHNTMKYYLATQELIWEKISGRETYWVTGASVNSPQLDVENEKREIENLYY